MIITKKSFSISPNSQSTFHRNRKFSISYYKFIISYLKSGPFEEISSEKVLKIHYTKDNDKIDIILDYVKKKEQKIDDMQYITMFCIKKYVCSVYTWLFYLQSLIKVYFLVRIRKLHRLSN